MIDCKRYDQLLFNQEFFIEFIKNDDSDDSIDSTDLTNSLSLTRRFIINVISSVINDSSSILSSLQNDLLLNWSFFFLFRHICFQWLILLQSKHSELIVEHFFLEWLTRSHLMHFLSSFKSFSSFSFESFLLFSFFLSFRLLSLWLFLLISASFLMKFITLSARWSFSSFARFWNKLVKNENLFSLRTDFINTIK